MKVSELTENLRLRLSAQALSLLLSLPQPHSNPTPRLGILTDLTHRLEHQDLQDQLNQLRATLQSSIASGNDALTDTGNSNVGRGEGSGPRWWHGLWDEDASEREGRLVLRDSAIANAGYSSAVANSKQAIKPPASVPDLRVAWDGMVVEFDRTASANPE